MKFRNNLTRQALLALTVTSLTVGAQAGEIVTSSGKAGPGVQKEEKEESIYDKIWGLATLYKNKDNPIIQEFKLRGRYHGQYHWVDSDQGDEDSWEDRRSRFGFDAKLFNQFNISFESCVSIARVIKSHRIFC